MGVYLELEDLQVNAMPFCSFVKVQPEAYSPLTILEHLFFATGNFGHLSQIACSMFCRDGCLLHMVQLVPGCKGLRVACKCCHVHCICL